MENGQGKMFEVRYYTGTGGTARAAKAIAEALTQRGAAVDVRTLRADTEEASPEATLILLYPVYAFNPPTAVVKWIAARRAKSATPAAVVSVSGGGEVSPNTACRVRVLRALKRAGYDTRYERMLAMPSNCIEATPDEFAIRLLRALPAQAARIADELLAGVRRQMKPLFFDRIVAFFGLAEELGAKRLGRAYYADDACTACGWCEKGCPQGNISMAEGKPVFGGNCALCLRCYYGCPCGAVRTRSKLVERFALKDGFDLSALERRMEGKELLPLPNKADWTMKGIFDYLKEEL